MINYQHKDLAAGRWATMSLADQMLNIGSEISRANSWRANGNMQRCHSAAARAIELLSLTIESQKGKHSLREFCRLHEVIADFYYGDNIYQTTPEELQKYFDIFIHSRTH